jgi:hypothetical protein
MYLTVHSGLSQKYTALNPPLMLLSYTRPASASLYSKRRIASTASSLVGNDDVRRTSRGESSAVGGQIEEEKEEEEEPDVDNDGLSEE